MSISVVGTATASSGSAATWAVQRPAGVAAGDYLVAVIRHQNGAANDFGLPSGWSRISAPWVANSTQRTLGLYLHRVGDLASEPSTYTFTYTSSGRYVWHVVALRSSTGRDILPGEYSVPFDGIQNTPGRKTDPFTTAHTSGVVVVGYGGEFTATNDHAVTASTPTGDLFHAARASSSDLSTSRTAAVIDVWSHSGTTAQGRALNFVGTATAPIAQAALLYESDPPAPADLVVDVYDGSSVVSMKMGLWDGTAVQRLSKFAALPVSEYGISAMDADIAAGRGVFWAHRGGSLNWPEMTMRAFTNAIWHGCKALEISMWRSADGRWIASHDSNLDRVTGTSLGEISATASSVLLGVPVTVPAPGGVTCALEDVVSAYGDFLLVVDNKPGTDFTGWLAHLKTLRPDDWADRFLIKIDGSAGLSRFQQAQAAGFKTAAYFYESTPDQTIADRMPYVDYPGMDSQASTAKWNALLAYGKPIWGHILQTQGGYDTVVAKGAKIFQCANVKGLVPQINDIP